LIVAAAAAAFGQANFVWDYNYIGGPYPNNWTQNGDSTYMSASGGSSIWNVPVSGTNPNDYNVDSSIYPGGGGGTYMHFLRANSTSVLPGHGSYISVEVTPASNWKSGRARHWWSISASAGRYRSSAAPRSHSIRATSCAR
jgi:hypothetical protein